MGTEIDGIVESEDLATSLEDAPTIVALLDWHGDRRWGPAATPPGAETAGGVGFAALAVLGASARTGIELLLELTGFHDKLPDTSLVITSEGSLDLQTLAGKARPGSPPQPAPTASPSSP